MEPQKNETLAFYAHLFNLYSERVRELHIGEKEVCIGFSGAKMVRDHMNSLIKGLREKGVALEVPDAVEDFLKGIRSLP